ncbi:MAG: hypothetical protein HYU29_02005 [Chloroflexi bacterium]|nr:hypothetical protein [Chloroflexota bacterium]
MPRDQGIPPSTTEGLLDQDPVTKTSIPSLATEWKTTLKPDGTVDWAFKLRKGVQFHKGWGEMTAEDIKFSLTEFQKPGSLAVNASVLVDWYGKDPKNIEIVNDYEFVVHSPKVMVQVEDLLLNRGFPPIYPKKYMDKVGEERFAENPSFTGPYEFAEHKRAQFLKLRALEEHWRIVPEFAEVNILVVPEVASEVAVMRTGKADMMELPHKALKEAQAAGMRLTRLSLALSSDGWFGGMWLKNRPTYDPTVPWVGQDILDPKPTAVRQAMNLALDRTTIVEKLMFGEGEATNTAGFAYTPGAAWTNPSSKPYPYDPKKAKELLAQAGYPNGFELGIWLVNPATTTNGPYDFDVSEAMASYWEAIGLKPNRLPTDYRPQVRQKLIDRKTGGWTYMVGNSTDNTPWGHVCTVLGASTTTIHHTEHPFIDESCAKMNLELDFKKRVATATELGDWIFRNYIMLPVAFGTRIYALSPRVDWLPTQRGQTITSRLEYARHTK